jgi:hypothetical protein
LNDLSAANNRAGSTVRSGQFLCLDLCFPGYGLPFLVVGIEFLCKEPSRIGSSVRRPQAALADFSRPAALSLGPRTNPI